MKSAWHWLRGQRGWFSAANLPVAQVVPVYRRVRLALYAMLLIVGAVAAWQAWQVEKTESVRLANSEIIRLAATQGMLSQRIGLLAVAMNLGNGVRDTDREALQEAVDQSQAQALQLEELLKQQGFWITGSATTLSQAVNEWQGLRERLWYRAQLLLRDSENPEPIRFTQSTRALRNEVELSLRNLQRLLEEAQKSTQAQAQGVVGQIEFSTFVLLLLLLTLTLGLAEPLVRLGQRQHRTLVAQSNELKLLALVAERTSSWVGVLDARRKFVWCNRAMITALGYELHELVGVHPVKLMQIDSDDPEELARVAAEVKLGLGVRTEVRIRVRSGQEIWLDLDLQPIVESAGQISGYTLVASDVTEAVNQRLRIRTLLNALPAGVVLQSAKGEVLECNAAAADLLGLNRTDIIGRPTLAREGVAIRDDLTPYPVEDRPTNRTLRTGKALRGEFLGLVMPQGNVRWLIVNTEPWLDVSGAMVGVVSCVVDVTQQRAEQQLLKLAVEGASLGLWEWDISTGAMSCNERLLELYGHTPSSLAMTATAWNANIHPDDLEGWLWSVRANLRDSKLPLHREIRIRNGRSGRWVWLMYSGTVVARNVDGRPTRMAGIGYDINSQKELEDQLRQTARTDSLTRLPNRSELLFRIHSSIRRTQEQPGFYFAVLFMDFDRFKQVNDTLGHAIGDELLRQIALRLQDSLRPSDAYVQTSDFSQMAARIGGDEFVVLLDNIRGNLDAQVVASRLLEVLAQPYEVGPHRVNSSVSIGIVTSEHMADDPDGVLRDADIAMYEAKRHGRNRYEMFDPSMRKRLRDDVSLENDLRHALEKGQLSVAYQPLIDLTQGRLVGMEALARWTHPQRGPVSPLVFIPVAEACGLIAALGQFVLRTACAEFMRLRSELGILAPESVAVNLSRAQLNQLDFVDNLSAVIRDAGMAPAQLTLEVTESLAAQDQAVQNLLHGIKDLGVALSLDDFGTGYSSLSCLHELPVDVVKIDRSFVSQALSSDYHRVMIEATIRMAQTLGLKTVAEGIETQEQADLMKHLGCGKGQGYLYSPPLAADALVQWVKTRGR
jgi:diguanylate cyclase (GGDEF)-like protein/PAS domain S-box-containing protein